MKQPQGGAPQKPRSPRWYLKQAEDARAAAAGKRGRLRSALLAAADQLERLAAIAEEMNRAATAKPRKKKAAPKQSLARHNRGSPERPERF